MQAVLARFDRLFPAQLAAHSRHLRSARRLALMAAMTAAGTPLLVLFYYLLGFDAAAIAVLCAGTVMVAAPLLLRAGASLEWAANLFIAAVCVLATWLATQLGGLAAPTVSWFILCPLAAALLGGTRPALVWSALVFKVVAVLFLWGRYVAPFVAHPVADAQVMALASHLVWLAWVAVLAMCFSSAAD